MNKIANPNNLLQSKAVTQTIIRVSVDPEHWPFSAAEYKLPFIFKMPTSEHGFYASLAKLCKHSKTPRSPKRKASLYETLGEILLLLWCEYNANQLPVAVLFEPTAEPIPTNHEKA